MTNMKTVLFTNESRAWPNSLDDLTKGWVFNHDNCAVGKPRQQSAWLSGYDLRQNDSK